MEWISGISIGLMILLGYKNSVVCSWLHVRRCVLSRSTMIFSRRHSMHTMWLCLQCPGRFCELLPGNLGTGEIIVKDIISQALKSLPLPELNYTQASNLV